MILNQNEINTIQNISSLEALKDYILNSVSTESGYTSDNISVRILSKEEYDKYIKNGTCDGAITANDVNVWHKIINKSTYIGANNAANPNWNPSSYAGYEVFIPATYVGSRTYAYTLPILFEMLLDNKTNVYLTQIESFPIKLHTSGYGSQQYTTTINSAYTNKNQSFSDWVWNGSCIDGGLNATLSSRYCFRPVLQYKDNKKSKNVYY